MWIHEKQASSNQPRKPRRGELAKLRSDDVEEAVTPFRLLSNESGDSFGVVVVSDP
jgi:hypothetical protein